MTSLTARVCAQCRKHPVNADYAPFCSKRCADVDLHKWLGGQYVVRAEEGARDGLPDFDSEAVDS
ncbi:MAG: DNA gyrase inhibitor YacG, partial [Asticcacaulis sp.]